VIRNRRRSLYAIRLQRFVEALSSNRASPGRVSCSAIQRRRSRAGFGTQRGRRVAYCIVARCAQLPGGPILKVHEVLKDRLVSRGRMQ